MKAIRPDWAILHVQYADEIGNARIEGPVYDDLLMSTRGQTGHVNRGRDRSCLVF